MGSNILAEELGWAKVTEIVDAFRELSEFNFVCKCNAKFIRSNPQNVLFVDWFQQNELLGKDISLVTHQLTHRVYVWLLVGSFVREQSDNVERNLIKFSPVSS
jgi:hypothetical protein